MKETNLKSFIVLPDVHIFSRFSSYPLSRFIHVAFELIHYNCVVVFGLIRKERRSWRVFWFKHLLTNLVKCSPVCNSMRMIWLEPCRRKILFFSSLVSSLLCFTHEQKHLFVCPLCDKCCSDFYRKTLWGCEKGIKTRGKYPRLPLSSSC